MKTNGKQPLCAWQSARSSDGFVPVPSPSKGEATAGQEPPPPHHPHLRIGWGTHSSGGCHRLRGFRGCAHGGRAGGDHRRGSDWAKGRAVPGVAIRSNKGPWRRAASPPLPLRVANGSCATELQPFPLGRVMSTASDAQVRDMPEYSVTFQALGTMILWFGWYGFNTGSALGSVGLLVRYNTATPLCTAPQPYRDAPRQR